MFKFIAVLLGVVIIGDDRLTSHGKQLERTTECQELFDCSFHPLKLDALTNFITPLTDLTTATALDSLCQKFPDLNKCFNDRKTRCQTPDDVTDIGGHVTLLAYVCTPDTKKAILDLAQTPCATNITLGQEIKDIRWACIKEQRRIMNHAISNNLTNKENMCKFLNDVYVCGTSNGTERCGDAFVQVMRSLWQTATKPNHDRHGCELES